MLSSDDDTEHNTGSFDNALEEDTGSLDDVLENNTGSADNSSEEWVSLLLVVIQNEKQ